MKTVAVILVDGSMRDFFCAFRAAEFAARNPGSVMVNV